MRPCLALLSDLRPRLQRGLRSTLYGTGGCSQATESQAMPEENELASEGLGSVGDLARLKSLRIRLERLQKGLNQYMKALVAEMEGRHFDANGVLATAQGLSQRLAAELSTAAAD